MLLRIVTAIGTIAALYIVLRFIWLIAEQGIPHG
jgi:hypothetical protein